MISQEEIETISRLLSAANIPVRDLNSEVVRN